MVVARDGSGSFSAQFDPVPAGTYTVAARQSDAAGQQRVERAGELHGGRGGQSRRPTFAVMAMDESIADAAAGRLTTLSSCEGACSRSASLTVSSRVASKLGLPHRGSAPVRLGGSASERGRGRREGRPEPQGAPRARAQPRGEGHARRDRRLRVAGARDHAPAGAEPGPGREPRPQARGDLLFPVHDRKPPDRERLGRAPAGDPLRRPQRGDRQHDGRRVRRPRPAPSPCGSRAACAGRCPARRART